MFNVEMQASNQYNVPKRSRYYHSIVDSDQLLSKNVDYNCLKNNYVIFICTFDPIGKGLPKYSFRMKSDDDNEINLDDGSFTVILNSSCVRKNDDGESELEKNNVKIDSELAAFLRYIENSTTEVANETDSVLMQKIHRKVQEVKRNKEVGVKYMKFQEMMKNEYNTGKNEGFELKDKLFELLESEGRLEEYAQSVKDKDLFEKLLQEHGLN